MNPDVSTRRNRARIRVVAATLLIAIGATASAQAGSGGVQAAGSDSGSKADAKTGAKMKKAKATWYGPGLWGNRTACGQTLKKETKGVAHKKLPCGTKVQIAYRGRTVQTRVIDRGPYAHGAKWDLTQAVAKRVRMNSTSIIRTRVVR